VDAPAQPPPYTYDGGRPFELLFVGRLVERKGVHLLLDALAALPPQRAAVLHVVGNGPDRERLEAQAQRLNLGERAVFHGFVSTEELQTRLRTCDALVLPAVVDAKGDTEGLGVVLIEAMSYARPVIASAAGGIVDIVRDGRNGLLLPPGDAPALTAAIERLMDDPERARAMGLAGREDVEADFSWDVIADRLAAIYRRVAAAPRGAGPSRVSNPSAENI
jgi:glycosyltransferase involved in cell wall biosynthesis